MAVMRRLVFAGFLLAILAFFPSSGVAQRIDIHITPPPPYRFAAAPPVVVVPGAYVYVVPDIEFDMFFCSGYWYRPYEGHWFRARSYGGPWTYWPDDRVPRALFDLPPGWRNMPPGHRRIPPGQLKRNWASWERNRYWERDPQWREGRRGRPEEGRREPPPRFDGRPGPGPGGRPGEGPGGPPGRGPGFEKHGPGGPGGPGRN